MRLLFTILAFQVFGLSAGAQHADSGFVLVKQFKGDIQDAAIDKLDNLYIVSSTGQLRKYNGNGDSVSVYNQVRNYGKLFSIDVTNPLQPVLFFKDFGTVVILDRFLANRYTLDLRKNNILQPAAVGLSYDNLLWVYDEYDNKLKKVDESGNKLLETADFRTVFTEPVRPQSIINENGLVYLADTASGIYVFDNYGSFKKKIAIKNWMGLAVKEQFIIHTSLSGITVYNTSTFTDRKRNFPSSFQPYVRAFSTSTRLAAFSKDSLRVYQYRF